MSDRPILQADPGASYRANKTMLDAALARFFASGRFILGPEVAQFERDFAAYVDCRHGIGVGSGTDALVLALKSLDLGPDDYVATVSHTAVATVAAIELAGAKPLLIDIDPARTRSILTRSRVPSPRHRGGSPRSFQCISMGLPPISMRFWRSHVSTAHA